MIRFPSTRLLLATGCVLAVAALSGCGHDDDQQITLKGRLVSADHQADFGPEASARVSLVAQSSQGSGGRIVAERTLHGIGQPPVAFRLSIGRPLLDSDGRYGLMAQVMNRDGEVVWQTAAPQPVAVFDHPGAARLVLRPSPTSPDGPFAHYRCGDGFEFQLAHDARGAVVHLGRRQISMHPGPSLHPGSQRYTDAHNDEIVIGEGMTSIYFDGVSHHDCGAVSGEAAAGV